MAKHGAIPSKRIQNNPSSIRNKMKRAEVMAQFRLQKKTEKKEMQKARQREAEEKGQEAAPKQVPNTLENTREADVTTVSPDDEEVMADNQDDEFASIFNNTLAPKLMITTRPKASGKLYHFIRDLISMFPNAHYYNRGKFDFRTRMYRIF